MINAILSNHDAINSLCQEIRSSAYGPDASDTNDDNSVYTNHTDGSMASTLELAALPVVARRLFSGSSSLLR